MDSDLFIMSLIGSFLQVVDKFTERTEHRYMPVKDEPTDEANSLAEAVMRADAPTHGDQRINDIGAPTARFTRMARLTVKFGFLPTHT